MGTIDNDYKKLKGTFITMGVMLLIGWVLIGIWNLLVALALENHGFRRVEAGFATAWAGFGVFLLLAVPILMTCGPEAALPVWVGWSVSSGVVCVLLCLLHE